MNSSTKGLTKDIPLSLYINFMINHSQLPQQPVDNEHAMGYTKEVMGCINYNQERWV
jgi:hypothetical protein